LCPPFADSAPPIAQMLILQPHVTGERIAVKLSLPNVTLAA
jgi:hypothetical protein